MHWVRFLVFIITILLIFTCLLYARSWSHLSLWMFMFSYNCLTLWTLLRFQDFYRLTISELWYLYLETPSNWILFYQCVQNASSRFVNSNLCHYVHLHVGGLKLQSATRVVSLPDTVYLLCMCKCWKTNKHKRTDCCLIVHTYLVCLKHVLLVSWPAGISIKLAI